MNNHDIKSQEFKLLVIIHRNRKMYINVMFSNFTLYWSHWEHW